MVKVVENNLPQIKKLCKKHKLKCLYLFGSATDPTYFNDDSDVDFLYEYDLSLRKPYSLVHRWSEISCVQHVYPNQPTLACWRTAFKKYSIQERKLLSGSLGNFVLIDHSIDEELCFNDKQAAFGNFANSASLEGVETWDKEAILKRGLEMLSFMEKRWNIKLGGETEKEKLLFLDVEGPNTVIRLF